MRKKHNKQYSKYKNKNINHILYYHDIQVYQGQFIDETHVFIFLTLIQRLFLIIIVQRILFAVVIELAPTFASIDKLKVNGISIHNSKAHNTSWFMFSDLWLFLLVVTGVDLTTKNTDGSHANGSYLIGIDCFTPVTIGPFYFDTIGKEYM